MSIYLARHKDGTLKSPYWQFDFVLKVNGVSRRFHGSTGETKEGAARQWVLRERERCRAEGPLDHLTLAAACYRYSEEVGARLASADDLDTAFEHICRLIGGGTKLVAIGGDAIAQAVRRRSAETVGRKSPRLVTAATVNRQILEPLKRLMRRARSVWGVRCDPAAIDWTALRMKEKPARVRELSSAEGEAFWAALRPDYAPLVAFLAGRGFRVRAAIAMSTFDVDLARATALVWKKGVGKVPVKLSSQQCRAIREEMRKAPELKAIWTYEIQRGKKKGQRAAITYAGLRRAIGNALSSAGIGDFHIHDLRHDFASKLLRCSRNLALVQKALGHSDIKSTVRYAHVLDDEVADAMDAMQSPEYSRTRAASNEGGHD